MKHTCNGERYLTNCGACKHDRNNISLESKISFGEDKEGKFIEESFGVKGQLNKAMRIHYEKVDLLLIKKLSTDNLRTMLKVVNEELANR